MAFKVQSEPKPKFTRTYCNREGHVEASCFQLHGYADWWGDRPRGGRGNGRGSTSSARGGGRAAGAAGRGKG